MTIGDWRRRRERKRLERRGDIVARWSDEAQALLDLGGDLIPGDDWELSRDLYGLLVYLRAVEADRDAAFDAHAILCRVRAQAWRGYTDMPALLREVRAALPRGETGGRMVTFFEELAAKRSTSLFLPVVARIDRHQASSGPLPIGALRVDGLTDRHAARHYGQLVRGMFAGGRNVARERDAFLLGVMVAIWEQGPWRGEAVALLALVATRLRGLYDDPALALSAVRADRVPGSPHEALAAEVVTSAEEIAVRAPWLWLDVLAILENALAGPQWFEHAFEAKAIPTGDDL